MDDIIEIILEIILEGGFELSKCKKVSKWIRYLLIIIISLLFLAVVILIFYLGIWIHQQSIALSIAFIVLSIAMLIAGINKFKQVYIKKK